MRTLSASAALSLAFICALTLGLLASRTSGITLSPGDIMHTGETRTARVDPQTGAITPFGSAKVSALYGQINGG